MLWRFRVIENYNLVCHINLIDHLFTFIPQMCHFQWNTSHWILWWIFNGFWHAIFNGSCLETTAVLKWPFSVLKWFVVWKQDHMADVQKRNILLGGYGKGMSRGLWPRDIPMPYPTHGILCFYLPAMWYCFAIFCSSFQSNRIIRNLLTSKKHYLKVIRGLYLAEEIKNHCGTVVVRNEKRYQSENVE